MIQRLNDQCLEEIILERRGLWTVAFLDYGSIPCDHFRPELEAIARKLDGRILFFSIDACENPSMADALGITAVPTLLVFRGDDEIGRYEGPYSREALMERLGKLVGEAT